MQVDNSTTVSEERATKKSLLKRLFGLYEIILFCGHPPGLALVHRGNFSGSGAHRGDVPGRVCLDVSHHRPGGCCDIFALETLCRH